MKRAAFSLMIVLLSVCALPGQADQEIVMLQRQHLNQHLKKWGYVTLSWSQSWKPITQQEAAALESELSHDPENAAARIRLLKYYWHSGLQQRRAVSVFWLIEHHPESPILGIDLTWLFPSAQSAGDHYGPMHNPADFIEAARLWDAAIATHPDVPEAFHNAARFFEVTDPSKSAELARRLLQLDPQGHGNVVAYYLKTVARSPAQAAELAPLRPSK